MRFYLCGGFCHALFLFFFGNSHRNGQQCPRVDLRNYFHLII